MPYLVSEPYKKSQNPRKKNFREPEYPGNHIGVSEDPRKNFGTLAAVPNLNLSL